MRRARRDARRDLRRAAQGIRGVSAGDVCVKTSSRRLATLEPPGGSHATQIVKDVRLYIDHVTLYINDVTLYIDHVTHYINDVTLYIDPITHYINDVTLYIDHVTHYINDVTFYIDHVTHYINDITSAIGLELRAETLPQVTDEYRPEMLGRKRRYKSWDEPIRNRGLGKSARCSRSHGVNRLCDRST
ncbi:MAG: hypothetical protein JXB07_16230 [Anaerolineae bacterium]|nr:hypothetical protein [Anaerolineae bacterium]